MDNNEIEFAECLSDMFAKSEEMRLQVEEAQIQYENYLKQIAQAHGSTFQDESTGQYYQIRTQQASKLGRPLTFICKLKAEPKTWLSRPRKALAPQEEAVEPEAANTVEELEDSEGIE